IAVALCVQRGLLDYSALVKTYWPEYEQNGKENTTVVDILSHRAGLTLDNYPMERILNWTGMVHTLEQREPQWSPGTAHDYHPLAYDHGKQKQILNENILKRAIKSNTPDNEIDITLGVYTKSDMGFLLYADMITSLGSNVFGHSGVDDSVRLAAPAKNFSFSYVINRMNINQQIKIDNRYKTMLDKIDSKLNDKLAF
ncbi:unnamed protein product, partial [Rotaria socialis]